VIIIVCVNVDDHIRQFLITPICGGGSQKVVRVTYAFSIAVLVAKELQDHYIKDN